MRWYNINKNEYPNLDEPVLLAKEPTTDFLKDCRLGRMVLEDNTNKKGWFVDNDFYVITIGSRPFWSPLVEKQYGIVETENEAILKNCLEMNMESLRLFEKKFQFIAASMIKSGNGAYSLDYYISGTLNRSLSLIYGFETLTGTANFMAAAHLVRPHLDNFLRLSAAWLVNDPHSFAQNVWKGDIIGKMKDRDGKLMSDSYLKKKASENYPWIAKVYEDTSGYIHFSEKHITNATRLNEKVERTLTTFIGKVDNDVSFEAKIEATICMVEISNCIALQIYGWLETKRIKG